MRVVRARIRQVTILAIALASLLLAGTTSHAQVLTVPDAPTGLITIRSNAQAYIAWNAPTITGGSPITSYLVTLNSSAGSLTRTVIAPSTSFTATGLTNGRTYWVTIQAHNVIGDSEISATGAVTPSAIPPKVPAAPVLSRVVTTTSRTLRIPYTLGNSNGSTITGVSYSLDAGANWTTTAMNPIVITGLTNATSYSIRIRAVNSVGAGAIVTKVAKPVATANLISFGALTRMGLNSPDQEPLVFSSGGTIVLTSTTTRICSIVGGKIHPLAVGSCSIRATNTGDATYAASVPVTRTAVIVKSVVLPTPSPTPTPTITASATPTATPTSSVSPTASPSATATPTPTPTPTPTVQTGPWTIRSTTFAAAQTGAAASWVSNGWYHAGLGWSRVYAYAGSTTALSYHVTDGRGAPAMNKTVTFIMGKTYSDSNAHVHVGSTYSMGSQASVTGTTNANGDVTFALVSDDATVTNTIYTQTAAYVDSPTVDTMDMLDINFYNAPITPSPYPTGVAPANSITSATIRLVSPKIDQSNSMDGTNDAASWVASHWYAPGLRYFTHEEFVGSTITLTYHASNQDGLAIINHPIYLSVNKICSGSNASFTSPSSVTPIGPAVNCLSAGGTLSGVTDGSGNVTFTLTNTNTDAQTGHFTDMFINYNADAHLYSQIMPFMFGPATYTQNPNTQVWSRNAGQYDVEDITNFIWSKHLPASPAVPTCSTGYLWCAEFNDAAGPLNTSATSGSQWLPNIGSGCPLLCGVAGNSHTVHTDAANQLDGNGHLLITATKQSNSTWACESDTTKTCSGEWTTGRVWTRNRVGFTYGKIEARIKAPLGSGTHPAFWMVGADIPNNPWPGSGEIDIMETNGDMPYTNWMTAHEPPVPCAPYCEGWQHEQKPDNNTMTNPEPLSSAYHTYGILWEPDHIQWTFDGVVKAEVRKGDYGCLQCWSFNKEYYIYLNLSMFDGFTGPTDPAMTSTSFAVDWVRYSTYNGYGTLTMH